MEGPDLIAMAMPFWLLLIVAEIVVTRVRGKRWYRINDTINSLSLGSIYAITGTLTKFVAIGTYLAVYQFALFELPEQESWVWVLGFIFYDLCYYWNHRCGHEINILWAAHSVHHQSEDYNLSTALRQTSMTFIFSWIFYTPMALLGIPPIVFFVAGALDLIYQFWIHTRHIPKLGWFEKYFVTPSNHRVHHGSNPVYMDKNYGGVFIIWDRIFGSFQGELDSEPVAYGISKPLRSWNPLWANLVVYAQLAKDAWHTRRAVDKLTIWFRRTGWRPADVAQQYPIPGRSSDYSNYDARPTQGLSFYVVLHFIISTLLGFAFLATANGQTMSFNALMSGLFILQFVLISRLIEHKPQALLAETLRLFSLLAGAYLWYQMGLISALAGQAVLILVLLSFFSAVILCRNTPSGNKQDSVDEAYS